MKKVIASPKAKKIRAAGYTRVSTSKQMRNGYSLEEQAARIKSYAHKNKIEITKMYTDVMSGGRDDRPQLMELMRDAQAGKFSLVMVVDIDRFGRDMMSILNNITRLESLEIDFYPLSGILNIENKTIRRMVLSQLAGLAELQRKLNREKTLRGMYQKLEKGYLNIFKPRFPLMFSEDQKSLILNPEHAELFELIKKSKLESELSYQKVADHLNALPLDKRLKKWSAVTVREVIENEDLVNGFVVVSLTDAQGDVIPDIERKIPCPKLLTEEEWERLQIISRKNITYTPGTSRELHLLSRMLRCERCDNILWIASSRGKLYYRCRGRKLKDAEGKNICNLPDLSMEHADRTIWYELIMKSQRWEFIEKAIKSATHNEEINLESLAERELQLDKSQKEIKKRENALFKGIEDGFYDKERIKERLALIDKDLKTIADQRAEIENQRAMVIKNSARKEEIKQAWLRIMKDINKATDEDKRRILKTLFPEKGSIRVEYHLAGMHGQDIPAEWIFNCQGIIDLNGFSYKERGSHTHHHHLQAPSRS